MKENKEIIIGQNRTQNIPLYFRGKNSLNSEYNCPASVLLWAKTSVGFWTFSMIFAMVNVFPRTCNT